MKFVHGDDVLYPHCLESMVESVSGQPDAACSSRSIDSPGPADESQELTCVDIDSFQESF